MGTRIWKQLGWGLTDLKEDDRGYTDDPRINPDALGHREELGPEYLSHLVALREAEEEASDAWFDLSTTIAMIEATQERNSVLPWPIIHSGEPHQGNVLLVQPVGFPEWSRYGDPIDTIEENLRSDDWGTPRTTLMPYGIHPFEGLYMDSRTGRCLDSTAVSMIGKLSQRNPEEGNGKYLAAANHLAKVIGFSGVEAAAEHIAPQVPGDIRQFCSWANLFTGPDVWLQLRPMLYVHWS